MEHTHNTDDMDDSFSYQAQETSITTQVSFDPCGFETHKDCFDWFLSCTPVHPVDSDDDCSIISGLSCDEDVMMEDDSMSPVDPLYSHESLSEFHGLYDCQRLDSSAVMSMPSASHFTQDACDSNGGDSNQYLTHDSRNAKATEHSCHFERLPDELLCFISSHLDLESLSRVRLVNKRLLAVTSRDEAGWTRHCQLLWSRKAHVPKQAMSLLMSGNARNAFYVASRDAVSRHYVLPEELCFNPVTQEGIVWSFRFKATAGAEWTSWDPWWNGTNKAREMIFLKDGRVMQYVRNDNGSYRFELPFHDQENVRPGLEVCWRFISQPMDLPKRHTGSYVRLTVAGRDVPTYIVHRSPTGNWGFVMESCWGVYASFPFKPRKQVNNEVLLGRPPRIRLRRTSHGEARWLNVADMESEDEAENEEESSHGEHPDSLEDSVLSVTTAWQWREAILHNQGLVLLPEGESAAAEFDRAYWGQTQPRGTDVVLIERN